jgi:hypothetical protein
MFDALARRASPRHRRFATWPWRRTGHPASRTDRPRRRVVATPTATRNSSSIPPDHPLGSARRDRLRGPRQPHRRLRELRPARHAGAGRPRVGGDRAQRGSDRAGCSGGGTSSPPSPPRESPSPAPRGTRFPPKPRRGSREDRCHHHGCDRLGRHPDHCRDGRFGSVRYTVRPTFARLGNALTWARP